MVISATSFTSQNTNNNLRDASFSSYLNNKKETFVDSSHPFIFNRKEPLQLGVKKEEDGEIGVFDAAKYFNGVEADTPTPRDATIDANKFKYMKNQQQTCLQNRKQNKVQYGTPSVGSESSLNSQNALLQTAVKDSSSNRKKNQVHRKSLLAFLGCKCSCYDKNSVDVNDHAGELSFNKGIVHGKSKTSSEKLFKHDQDASKKTETRATAELMMNKDIYLQKQEKISTYNMQLQQVENPRKTLGVFGSPILYESCKSLSFDMRLKKPSWEEAGSKLEEEIEFSTNSGEIYEDDEAGSDASSDLFEIESFTGKTNPSFCRTSSNVASGCASPTCYAPSEASIEWSVITASAVEYSAVSDHEDQDTIRTPTRTSLNSSNGKTRINKDIPRRRPSKLLGCNSQKSVGVAVDAFTATYDKDKQSTNPKIHGKSDMLPQVTRLKVDSVGARNEQHGYAKPPIRRSQSPHSAQILYI